MFIVCTNKYVVNLFIDVRPVVASCRHPACTLLPDGHESLTNGDPVAAEGCVADAALSALGRQCQRAQRRRAPTPITTAIEFGVGHRIRVEVTSSNFPKFVRNLNTGGPNESEKEGVIADNVLHHAGDQQCYIELPVLR